MCSSDLGGNFVVDTDPVWGATSGSLTTYEISPDATQTGGQTVGQNSATFDFAAARSLTVGGYVETSAGRATTTVHQEMTFASHQVLNLVNFLENLRGSEAIVTTVTSSGAGGTTVVTVSDSYPIALSSAFIIPPANLKANPATARFILPATVDQAFIRHVTLSRDGRTAAWSALSDSVHAEAVLVRSLTTGHNLVANGHESEDYDAFDSSGTCYHHVIAAAQGYVTSDRLLRRC